MGGSYRVAAVGATGAVGEAMLSILAERRFPVGELIDVIRRLGLVPADSSPWPARARRA